MKMSFVTLKNEAAENVIACRACLTTKRKLYSIHQYNLSDAYKNLVGIDGEKIKNVAWKLANLRKTETNIFSIGFLFELRIWTHQVCQVSPYDTFSQYICNYCTAKLLKYNAFRDSCQKANNYLQDAKIRNEVIPNNYLTDTQYKNTATKIISITETEIIDDHNPPHVKIDDIINQFDDFDDVNNQYTSPQENNQNDLKIFTDIVKLEIEEADEFDEPTKRKKVKDKEETNKKKGKYFETKDNMRDFEKAYDVDVIVLSKEEQMKEFLDRKLGLNYLHSPYKCDLCYKGYMGADILDKHVLSQHDPSRGNVVCEFCRFRYKDRRGLNQHLKSHRLKFACKQCSYVSRTTFNAKEHYKMHGGHMHECRHCGKSYEKMSSHLSHLRIRHPSEFIWCDVCGEAFIGTFGLNAHKKRAHRCLTLPHACPNCDKHFLTASALNLHTSVNKCNECHCVHCGQGFREALELRDHLLSKHRTSKVFACEKCDKTFARESHYSAHYKRIHVDSKEIASRKKERPWICEVCGKTLPNQCVLRYHQRNHTGEKPYHCTQCSKSFTMRKLLQSHLRVHTSDRPFICKLCPKAFKGLSALRAHEHIHTDEQTKPSSKNMKI